jgi:hypothetical protein
VVLSGHALAPHAGSTVLDVHLSVGPLSTDLRVTGDRVWHKGFFGKRISPPQPFERLPLIYERAFGGVDGPADDPARQVADERNPIGRGFRRPKSPFVDGVALPNIEHPQDPVVAWDRPVAVAGTGFLAPAWQPRRAFAGTYDAAWQRERPGLLPKDFDRRFFNAAHPALISRDGYLRGDEPVRLRGVTPGGDLAFDLPRLASPAVVVVRPGHDDLRLTMPLDTVRIDTDAMHLTLIWRGHATLAEGPLEVSAIAVDHPATTGA